MTDTITILLATYNPNVSWLKKQLSSLNGQDYAKLELLVLDDCSTTISLEELDAVLKSEITAFPYKLMRGSENLGSTKTFERLTEMAEGRYVAYCDQDDIWERTKLHRSLALLKRRGTALVCGDVRVIDGEDKITEKSITELHPRHVFPTEKKPTEALLFHNFAIGCTILMETKTAKAALPFIDCMIHDHWLALFSACNGGIAVLDEPLMRYRVHGGNQTGVLAGISTKQDYYEARIYPFLQRITEILLRLSLGEMGETARLWAVARVGYYNKNLPQAGALMWKCRHLDKKTTYFELAMKFLPQFAFKKIITSLQKGKL